jgi:hypothetical protein
MQPKRLDPFFSVARGAAAWAYLSEAGFWNIRERIPDSLFLKRRGHPFLEIFPAVNVPSETSTRLIDSDDCPYVGGPGNVVRLEFYQGTAVEDPLMSLAHVEHVRFPRDLDEETRLVEVSGRINKNKVYEFTLVFEGKDGRIPASVSFGAHSRAGRTEPTEGPPMVLNGRSS